METLKGQNAIKEWEKLTAVNKEDKRNYSTVGLQTNIGITNRD